MTNNEIADLGMAFIITVSVMLLSFILYNLYKGILYEIAFFKNKRLEYRAGENSSYIPDLIKFIFISSIICICFIVVFHLL